MAYIKDNKKDVKVNTKISFDYCLLKKHCHPSIKFSNCALYKQSNLNIKLVIPTISLYILALAQNYYKLENKLLSYAALCCEDENNKRKRSTNEEDNINDNKCMTRNFDCMLYCSKAYLIKLKDT